MDPPAEDTQPLPDGAPPPPAPGDDPAPVPDPPSPYLTRPGGTPRPRPSAREPRARPPAPGGARPQYRLPAHLTPTQILDLIRRERREALDVRDPIAIALAAERFNTAATILEVFAADDALDLHRPLLSVSQTAKMLGYNAKEVRRLLGQGKIAGRKMGNEWRIPLWAVL